MDYDWPGNVRELENVVERGVVLSTQELLEVDLLPEAIRTRAPGPAGLPLSGFLPAPLTVAGAPAAGRAAFSL